MSLISGKSTSLSDKSTLYSKVVFSDNYVDLSDVMSDVRCYVNLSDNDVDLSDLYVDLSDIMSICQIILLLSVWH